MEEETNNVIKVTGPRYPYIVVIHVLQAVERYPIWTHSVICLISLGRMRIVSHRAFTMRWHSILGDTSNSRDTDEK